MRKKPKKHEQYQAACKDHLKAREDLVWHREQRLGLALEAFLVAGQNIDVHAALTRGLNS